MSSVVRDVFRVGIGILRTVIGDTGAILAQTGDAATDSTETDRVAWWQQVGFLSRPSKAEAGKKSAEAVVIRLHGHDISIASRDLRGLELAGNLEEGETMIYAPGETGTGQARILLKANGNIAIFTRSGNAENGAGVTIQANADGSIVAQSEHGAMRLDADGWRFGCGSAALQLGSDGKIAMIGTEIALNGGAVSIGANATTPVVGGLAGISGIGSTSVKVAL